MARGDASQPTAEDCLAGVEAAIELFRLRSCGEQSAWHLRSEMRGWRQLIDRMELEFAGMANHLADLGEDEWEGHQSAGLWVKHECRTTGTAAFDALVVGQQSARLEASAEALLEGGIGYAHLALISRTADWVTQSATSTRPAPAFDEARLLRLARKHTVAQLRHDCAHLRHVSDPRRFLEEQVEQLQQRFLELKATEGGGLWMRGFLDSEGGATLRTALEPLARPSGPDDGRGRDQRLADSLVELAAHALDSGKLPHHAGQRPQVQVTVSLETLEGGDGSPAAELELAGPLSAETARRLGCDAQVSRVVFGPGSAVVDVGRATRVPPPSTRRAVKARDQGCVWPGCGRPASWAEIHHLRHWARGGLTDMSNLVTICRVHHWRVHEGGWRLIRTGNGFVPIGPVPSDIAPAATRAPDLSATA